MTTFLAVSLPLLTASITAGVTYYFTRKRDIEQHIRQEKLRRYEHLITNLKQGFLNSRLSDDEKTTSKDEYYTHSYVVWLYASDDVIRSLNAFAHAFAAYAATPCPASNTTTTESLNELMLAMRRDTLGRTALRASEFVSTSVT